MLLYSPMVITISMSTSCYNKRTKVEHVIQSVLTMYLMSEAGLHTRDASNHIMLYMFLGLGSLNS